MIAVGSKDLAKGISMNMFIDRDRDVVVVIKSSWKLEVPISKALRLSTQDQKSLEERFMKDLQNVLSVGGMRHPIAWFEVDLAKGENK